MHYKLTLFRSGWKNQRNVDGGIYDRILWSFKLRITRGFQIL